MFANWGSIPLSQLPTEIRRLGPCDGDVSNPGGQRIEVRALANEDRALFRANVPGADLPENWDLMAPTRIVILPQFEMYGLSDFLCFFG